MESFKKFSKLPYFKAEQCFPGENQTELSLMNMRK